MALCRRKIIGRLPNDVLRAKYIIFPFGINPLELESFKSLLFNFHYHALLSNSIFLNIGWVNHPQFFELCVTKETKMTWVKIKILSDIRFCPRQLSVLVLVLSRKRYQNITSIDIKLIAKKYTPNFKKFIASFVFEFSIYFR